jgi:hypothetical protein
MTWSLRILNGDLAKGYDNSIDTVWGSDKVIQDLMCWIRQPIGTDPMNPELGTFIEIGEAGQTFVINNQMVDLPSDFSQMVLSEIRRVISAYQLDQGTRARDEIAQFGRVVTFQDDEIIGNFTVNYTENYDTLYVTISIDTITGESYTLNVPVQNDAIIKGV